MTEIIKIDIKHPEPAFVRCREIVSQGGIVIYPTDTFYGLGVDPENAAAVKRLFDIKGREANQPILLLLSEAGQVRNWAAEIVPQAESLMKTYWPGPLTLVFKAKPHVLASLTGGKGTIGLRVPGNAVTRGLLGFIGTALTGTSANVSGGVSPRTAEEASAAVGAGVDLILDGGPSTANMPSTVVDVTAGQIRVLREGAVRIAGCGVRNSE